jgi:antitoxin YefM
MDALTFSEARANLSDLMDRVVADRTPVVIVRNGAEGVVLVSLADWNATGATLHLLSTLANAGRLREAVCELGAEGSAS